MALSVQHQTGDLVALRKEASRGNANAQLKLGKALQNGSAKHKSAKEALKWYQKAAKQGNLEAEYRVGLCYYKGIGIDVKMAEALSHWRKACDKGNSDAQFALGLCFLNGEGVKKDARGTRTLYLQLSFLFIPSCVNYK